MFFTTLCIVEGDCTYDKILQGSARNSDPISNAKSGVLYSEFLYMYYAGAQCGHSCLDDSSEWNYFEVRKVSPHFPLNVNSGVGEDDHVLLFRRLQDARHPTVYKLILRFLL